MAWLNNQNYLIAKQEFEKAALFYPSKTEPKEKIRFCEVKMDYGKPNIRKQIEKLLIEVRSCIDEIRKRPTTEKIVTIRQKIVEILQLNPENREAGQYLAEIIVEEILLKSGKDSANHKTEVFWFEKEKMN